MKCHLPFFFPKDRANELQVTFVCVCLCVYIYVDTQIDQRDRKKEREMDREVYDISLTCFIYNGVCV